MMSNLKLKTIILAAGQGSRMNSTLSKVCHKIGGRPLLHYVLDCASQLQPESIVTVLSPHMPEVEETVHAFEKVASLKVNIAWQTEQRGTGHALLAAQEYWQGFQGAILVLYGDTPLLSQHTLQKMIEAYSNSHHPAIVVLGMRCDQPNRYGRIGLDDTEQVTAIVEYEDATPEQINNDLCNSGVMLIDGRKLEVLLQQLNNHNQSKEYYLTDLVHLARAQGDSVVCVEGDEQELLGVNSRHDLSAAEGVLQNQWRQQAMTQGVTLLDPQSCYFSFDTKLGRDVIISPHVSFGPGVIVEDDVTIRPFCHFDQAHICSGVTIGPFAHLRPGSVIGSNSRIGNFVEIKNTQVGEGAKINHLSYIGDAKVGDGTNIGAGTITCNYDGFSKHQTVIGQGVSIGANTCLVAPVVVGDQAIVGAGSVITKEIPQDALGLSRSPQKNLASGARHYRHRKQSSK